MELIQALELLSLEVRNQQANSISTSNVHLVQPAYDGMKTSHEYVGQESYETYKQCNWRYPSSSHQSKSNQEETQRKLQQLQEFDESVDTLFDQLSDLESDKTNINTHSKLGHDLNTSSDRHSYFRSPRVLSRRINYATSSSLETSQEEDSDCSSQQSSSYAHPAIVYSVPKNQADTLVKDLLRRDISAITDTVRRISRILSIGNKIEIIYNNLSTNQTLKTLSNPPIAEMGEVDTHYIRTLCNVFTELSCSELHIKDLPTIKRYVYYCNEMFILLNKLEGDSTTQAFEGIQVNSAEIPYEVRDIEVDIDEGGNNDANFSSSDGRIADEEVCFLDCNPSQVNNWTENKLYVNNPSLHQQPYTKG